jgi:thermitase
VRRPLLALLCAVLGVVALASPASAGANVDVVVAYEDGSLEVRHVPVATAGPAIDAMEREPDVRYAEVSVPLRAVAVAPNDPDFNRQWGVRQTRAPAAWDRSTGSASTVIAVVDSGVDASHPDLAGQLLPGVDCITVPGDCRPAPSIDPFGHGTGVAGVVAANGNDRIGVAGYCWGCKILPVRSLNELGSGNSASVAAGIRWAADNGADIINLSLAGSASDDTLREAIDHARSRGAIVVAAAGNQSEEDAKRGRVGPALVNRQYPAALPGVLSVIATDTSDAPYPWTYRGSWADVAAPGCTWAPKPVGGYKEQCGTSFASPAVAGILGLALSAAPRAPIADVEGRLMSTSAALPSLGLAAAGRVDAAALLDALSTNFPTVAPERVAGTDRVSTAVALSQRARPTATSVIIARADSYADALAAAPLAGSLGAPVLLTASTGLSGAVAAEIKRLGATSAVLVGGTGALGPAIEDAVTALGAAPRRIAGASRYDTARLIATEVGGSSVYVTQASGWPDAVAVSGLAALTKSPILLVDHGSVPAATFEALSALKPSSVTVIGGPGVVSEGVVQQLAATRVAGANRYETSAAVAALAAAAGADVTKVWVATGADWPDALAAGPASAADGAVLRLVNGKEAGSSALLSGVKSLVVVGGEASVTTAVLGTLAGLLL